MNRRTMLQLTALAACTRPLRPSTGRVRAVAFDLFTIFDPRSVARRCAEIVRDDPGAFAAAWLTRLFEYCWLHGLAGRYVAFDRLAMDSLDYVARSRGIELSERARGRLAGVFVELELWPDSRAALQTLRDRGFQLAPLANFAPQMIRDLLATARLTELFDRQLSTDAARTYKPDPRAYALAERELGHRRDEIAFAAFGRWDAWGANAFGLRTFWVNRLASVDELGEQVASGPDLTHLAAWVAS